MVKVKVKGRRDFIGACAGLGHPLYTSSTKVCYWDRNTVQFSYDMGEKTTGTICRLQELPYEGPWSTRSARGPTH